MSAPCPNVVVCPCDDQLFSVTNPTPPPPTIPPTPPTPPTVYQNSAVTAWAYCPVGDSGGPFSSTIAANTLAYNSTISQADATAKAQAAAQLLANAQLMACGLPSQFSGLLWTLPTIDAATTTVGNVSLPSNTTPFVVNVASTAGFGGANGMIGGYLVTITAIGASSLTLVNNTPSNGGKVVLSGASMYQLNPASSSCPLEYIVSEVTQGTPGNVNSITFRLRGIIETKVYAPPVTSGTPTSYVVKSRSFIPLVSLPANPGNPSDEYVLVVDCSALAVPLHVYSGTYFLNAHYSIPTDLYPGAVDYNLTVPVPTGAMVSLAAYSIDSAEFPNIHDVVANNAPPPIQVVEPYCGQFLQCDVVSIA